MAIAFVQSTSTPIVNSPLSFVLNNTLGNTIIVLTAGNVSSVSISDTNLNVYTNLPPIPNSSNTSFTNIFYCTSIKAGPNAITITASGATTGITAIHEFSGLSSFSNIKSASGIGNAQDSGALATSFNTTLIFGGIGGAVAGTMNSITAGVSWNLMESGISGGTATGFLTEYQILSSTGTFNTTSSTSAGKGGTFDWNASILTFIPGGLTTKTSVIQFGF